jgi:hypothetical protein
MPRSESRAAPVGSESGHKAPPTVHHISCYLGVGVERSAGQQNDLKALVRSGFAAPRRVSALHLLAQPLPSGTCFNCTIPASSGVMQFGM